MFFSQKKKLPFFLFFSQSTLFSLPLGKKKIISLFTYSLTLCEKCEELRALMADNKAGPQSAEELTTFVQSMLAQMQSRFQQMSDEIITKIDDLGNRIEELDEQVSKMSDREKEDETERVEI